MIYNKLASRLEWFEKQEDIIEDQENVIIMVKHGLLDCITNTSDKVVTLIEEGYSRCKDFELPIHVEDYGKLRSEKGYIPTLDTMTLNGEKMVYIRCYIEDGKYESIKVPLVWFFEPDLVTQFFEDIFQQNLVADEITTEDKPMELDLNVKTIHKSSRHCCKCYYNVVLTDLLYPICKSCRDKLVEDNEAVSTFCIKCGVTTLTTLLYPRCAVCYHDELVQDSKG